MVIVTIFAAIFAVAPATRKFAFCVFHPTIGCLTYSRLEGLGIYVFPLQFKAVPCLVLRDSDLKSFTALLSLREFINYN